MFRYRMLSALTLLSLILLLVACNQQEESSSSSVSSTDSAGNAHGQKIYDSVCHSCHSTGVAGAPKMGDQSAWKDRIAKGMDVLVQSAINGKGNMPPKGGERTLNEKDIRAAVTYMVDQSR